MRHIRTDLALEASETAGEVSGVTCQQSTQKGVALTRVTVETKEAGQQLGKAPGTYLTASLPKLWSYDYDQFSECVEVLGSQLRELLKLAPDAAVLVVGLGNRDITPDALGPVAVEHLMVTRHLKQQMPQWFSRSGLRRVAAFCPNVLGNTGIETAEIVLGVCRRLEPDAVVVIDALAARQLSRLMSTVQIADSGISPGSGVANSRQELSQATLGVPVVSMGVPTVVDAATLAGDVMEMTTALLNQPESVSLLPGISPGQEDQLFSQVLAPYDLNLLVTPKDIDRLIQNIGKMAGFAVNWALHSGVSVEDMAKITSG